MIRALLLNSPDPDDGFEQRLFGADMTIGIHAGPGFPGSAPTPEECAAAQGIVSRSANHDIGEPAQFPNLRVLVRMGVGYDSLDIAKWGRAGVAVCNVPDYGTSEVADHAMALTLALARGTETYHSRLVAGGAWGWAGAPCVRRLRGTVFGVVGLGRIGLAAALRARAFGMELAFYDPYAPNGLEIAVGARRVNSLPELLAMSGVVSIHAPLGPETRGMVNREALAAANPDLLLVNTARGAIVDVDALCDALEAGRIAGAALDVLPEEPIPQDHRLLRAVREGAPWAVGRVVLTPHAAFYSPDAMADMRRKSWEVILHFLRDGRLTNCVNREFLSRNFPG